jgi:hypothetical protein
MRDHPAGEFMMPEPRPQRTTALPRHLAAFLVLLAALMTWMPTSAGAQAATRRSGPEAGTWGAEAGVGSIDQAALMRFWSARWALRAAASISSTEVDNGILGGRNRFTTTSLLVGARRYGRSGLGVRPVIGFGAVIFDTPNTSTAGGYGELGAVYFFNPHVSLGATGQATLSFGDNSTNFGVSLARLIGAVYF